MIMIYLFIEGKLIDFVKENYLLAFEKINRINFFFFSTSDEYHFKAIKNRDRNC